MSIADRDLGKGDEYELRGDVELIVADPKVRLWRKQQFVAMGFCMSDAEFLSDRRDADLHKIATWLKQGCPHELVLDIVAPLEQTGFAIVTTDEPLHLPEFGGPS